MMPHSPGPSNATYKLRKCAPRLLRTGQGVAPTDPREGCLPCKICSEERGRQKEKAARKEFVTIKRWAKHSEIYVFMSLSLAEPKVFLEKRKIFMMAASQRSVGDADEKLPKPMRTM